MNKYIESYTRSKKTMQTHVVIIHRCDPEEQQQVLQIDLRRFFIMHAGNRHHTRVSSILHASV